MHPRARKRTVMRIDSLLLALDRILAKQTHAARWEALALAADARELIELRETHTGPTPELTKLRELLDPMIDTLAMGKGSYVLPLAKEKLVKGLERLTSATDTESESVPTPDSVEDSLTPTFYTSGDGHARTQGTVSPTGIP